MSQTRILFGLLTLLLAAQEAAAQSPLAARRVQILTGAAKQASQVLDAKDPWASFQLAPTLPKPSQERNAVKLSYVMMDDPLDAPGQVLLKTLDDRDQNGAHSIVFYDGAKVGDSRLYFIEKGDGDASKNSSAQSLLAPGVEEVASNNPHVFAKVLDWTLTNYPARRRYLQILSHGGGAYGLGTDQNQTAPNGQPMKYKAPVMPLPDFAAALRVGLRGRKLDVIYFLACLMGNVEAMYEIEGTAQWAVTSEYPIRVSDHASVKLPTKFEEMLSRKLEPHEIARELAVEARAKTYGSASGYDEAAVIKVDKMSGVRDAADKLAGALISALSTKPAEVVAAWEAVPEILDGMRDLWLFANEVKAKVSSKDAHVAATDVQAALKEALGFERTTQGSQARGLSIFMPGPKSGLMSMFFRGLAYPKTRFAKNTRWPALITQVLAAAKKLAAAPAAAAAAPAAARTEAVKAN